MKRWPIVVSFLLFIVLCASIAYWAMQFFKPDTRPVVAPPPAVQAPPNLEAAASLFGGRTATVAASNFQLKGVIVSGSPSDSVAILVAEGKPAQAVRANMEIMPGVKVKEVHRRYVVLVDQGVEKRVELPEDAKGNGLSVATTAPVATSPALSPPSTVAPAPNNPPSSEPAAPSMTPNVPPGAQPAMPQLARPSANQQEPDSAVDDDVPDNNGKVVMPPAIMQSRP